MKHDDRCKHTPYESDSFKVFNSMEKYYIRRCKKCRKLIKQPVFYLPLICSDFVVGVLLYYFTEISISSWGLIMICTGFVINWLPRVLPWREVREDELERYGGDTSMYFKEKQKKYDNWISGIVYSFYIAILLGLFF